MYVYNSSPEIDSCWIYDEPVYVNNGNPHIAQGYFDDQASYGYSMTLYSASPTFYRNEIISTNAQVTIQATKGSDPYFGNTPPGLNLLSAGEFSDGVIWAMSGSHPVLGDVEDGGYPIAPYYGTQNSILGGTMLSPAYADGSSSVLAEHCWWGQTPPPMCMGNVDQSEYMTSAPVNVGSSFYKRTLNGSDNDQEEDDVNVKSRSMITQAKRKIKEGDYASARELLSSVITRYSNSNDAYKALSLGVKLCTKYKEQDALVFIDDLMNKVQNKDLRAAINSRKVSQLRSRQRINEAIAVSETMLKENANTDYEMYALFDLFNYYHKDLNEAVQANMYLAELKEKYPESNLTMIAMSDTGEDVSGMKLAKQIIKEESEIEMPEKFKVYAAYPNPFNPTTRFDFDLPVSSEVNCKIFDIGGHLVREYRMMKEAGQHSISWDGSNMSSGIYLIHFIAESTEGLDTFVDYQKVTLLK